MWNNTQTQISYNISTMIWCVIWCWLWLSIPKFCPINWMKFPYKIGVDPYHNRTWPKDIKYFMCSAYCMWFLVDGININRNWRFHFIAHYYWFLLHSLTKPIEIRNIGIFCSYIYKCVWYVYKCLIGSISARNAEKQRNQIAYINMHSQRSGFHFSNGMLFVHEPLLFSIIIFIISLLVWIGINV